MLKSKMSENKEKYISPERGGLLDTAQEYTDCELKEGIVVPRAGLRGGLDSIIYRSDFSPYTENELRLTDCYLYFEGRYCRVAVAIADDLMDSAVFHMRLIFSDGEIMDIGSVTFGRVSADQYGYPSSFTVFSGTPKRGCGVFLIARQVYGEGYEDFIRIMELSAAKTEWIMLTDSDMYLPTLLANGRGESYYMACPFGERLQLPAPIRPQSRNLLYGGFSAYFTTDSASSGFFLPLDELDNGRIVAELEDGGVKVRWIIPEGGENSEETEVDGQSVIMLCDRPIGRVYFKKPDGMDYPLTYTGKVNNLRITASKGSLAERLKVASCTASVKIEGQSSINSGSVNAFYGSFLYPDEVVISSPLNPLYFPEDSCYTLGGNGTRVTKLVNQSRTLLAFKDDRLYAAEISPFKTTPSVAAINGGVALDVTTFSSDFRPVSELSASPIPETVTELGDGLAYLSRDGFIYRLIGSSARYTAQRLCEAHYTGRDFAVTYEGRYLCFHGNTATVVEMAKGKPSVSRWRFPVSPTAGFSRGGRPLLFSGLNADGVNVIYLLRFGEWDDRYLSLSGGLEEETESPVEAAFSFSPFEKSCHAVKLIRLRIDSGGQNMTVTVKGEEGPESRHRATVTGEKALVLCGKIARHPRVCITFKKGEISGVAVEYRRLQKL